MWLMEQWHCSAPVPLYLAAVSTMLIIVTGLCLVVAERWVGFHRFA